MQHLRWYAGAIAILLSTAAFGQVPGTIPPIKLPPAVTVKRDPGMAAAIEAREPFIEKYVFCNSMQLYQSRLAVWEPVYRDSGASDAELNTHSANLVSYIKTFCSNGPSEYWQSALDKVEAFDDLTDRRTAKALGVSLQDATALRLSRLLANVDAFQRECLGGQEEGALEDLLTVAGSLLPATVAPPGMSLPRKDLSTTLGKCGPKPNLGSSGAYASLDQRSLSQCIDNALAQSATCDSPVADGPRGPVKRQETLGGESRVHAAGRATVQDYRLTYANRYYTEVHSEKVTRLLDGHEHTTEWRTERTYAPDGTLYRQESSVTNDGHEVARSESTPADFGPPSSASERRIIESGERLRVGVPAGFLPVTVRYTTHDRGFEETVTNIVLVEHRRECLSVNSGSTLPLGLSRIVGDATSGGNPVRAGRLNTFDMIGHCLCTALGKTGADLAARSGMRCGPDANTRRLDCLLNPRGPADGIRPECVEYLNADNPDRDTPRALNEWCGRVAQCPPGAGMATTSATGVAMCSCGNGLAAPRGGGSGAPGGGTCARVSCAQGPGAAGSDLYQQCCGVPGEVPVGIDPSSGPSVPPPRGPPSEIPKMPTSEMPMQPLPPN